jgi:hypothetical protein
VAIRTSTTSQAGSSDGPMAFRCARRRGAWIRVLARHSSASSSYSAAKHGVALAGAVARGTLTVGENEIVRAQGSVLSWLVKWPEPGAAPCAAVDLVYQNLLHGGLHRDDRGRDGPDGRDL